MSVDATRRVGGKDGVGSDVSPRFGPTAARRANSAPRSIQNSATLKSNVRVVAAVRIKNKSAEDGASVCLSVCLCLLLGSSSSPAYITAAKFGTLTGQFLTCELDWDPEMDPHPDRPVQYLKIVAQNQPPKAARTGPGLGN